MTPDELRAARERWREYRHGKTNPFYGDEMLYRETVARICDAYLAEHPADDEAPIDEAWLRSVGFYESAEYGGDREIWLIDIADSTDDSICCNLYTTRIELWIGSRYITIPGKTRGDVRRICAELGITLKQDSKP